MTTQAVPTSHLKPKRVHEPAGPADGTRILVDRLWSRGLRKADAAIDRWLKEVAPSTELRLWFGHDPARRPEFHRRQVQELQPPAAALDEIPRLARHGTVMLLFGACDDEHNGAVVLRDVLLRRRECSANAGTPTARQPDQIRGRTPA